MTKNTSKSKTEGKIEKTETAYIVDGYEVKKERVLSRLNSMSKVTIDLITDIYGRDLDYVIAEKIRKEDADEEERQRRILKELEAKQRAEEQAIFKFVRELYDAGKIILISGGLILEKYPEDSEYFTLPEVTAIQNAANHTHIIYGDSSEPIHMKDAKVVYLKEKDMQVVCMGV